MTLLLGQDKKTQLIMFTQINAAAQPAHTPAVAEGTAKVCVCGGGEILEWHVGGDTEIDGKTVAEDKRQRLWMQRRRSAVIQMSCWHARLNLSTQRADTKNV